MTSQNISLRPPLQDERRGCACREETELARIQADPAAARSRVEAVRAKVRDFAAQIGCIGG
jgi:hypothetical protein